MISTLKKQNPYTPIFVKFQIFLIIKLTHCLGHPFCDYLMYRIKTILVVYINLNGVDLQFVFITFILNR